jgi:putative ABC transport system permease protein
MSATTLRLRILAAALASQRVRAVIAAAMVSLGVASTLVMVALSAGARLEMEVQQERMGRNLFFVRAAERPVPPGRGNGWFASSRLKPEQAALIERAVPAVLHAVPVRERPVQVKLDSKRVVTTVRGVTPEFFPLRNFEIERGRAIDATDGMERRRVIVIGPFVKDRLSNGRSLLGEIVRLGNVPFEVVGELRAKGAGTDGSDQDDQVLIPFETSIRRFENVEAASLLLVQARDEAAMRPAIDGVRELLREAHFIEPGARDDFDILETIRQNVAREMSNRWLQGLSRVLATVTLVLGGIGVFAVSYLNVKERTGEIGLRMAVGATRLSIAALFVAEACVLSILGGIAGVTLGALVAELLQAVTEWRLAIDLRGVFLPFAVSAITGVGCSLVPAWRASRVMPALALAE